MSFVTFVIPTLNRSSLQKTLESLLNQSDADWNAIVIGDGKLVTETITDPRIKYISMGKRDGGAGEVRNTGLDMVTSDWTAFVDDDDYLATSYVSKIKYYSLDHDLIQFTYIDLENGNVQPPPLLNKLVECNFGISFAIDTKFMNDNRIRFTPGVMRDYRFLRDSLNAGARFCITHEILYYVGHRSDWGRR